MSTVINTLTTTQAKSRLKLTDKNTFDKAAYQAYETLKADRDALQEAEKVYKKRIDTLEQESKDLLHSYEGIYSENEELRSKVDSGSDDAELKRLQDEIVRLESKTTTLQTTNTMLQGDILSLQKQTHNLNEEKHNTDKEFVTERQQLLDKNTSLEKENNEMRYRYEKQEAESLELKKVINNFEGKYDSLTDKYKSLKRNKIKLETTNKQQKDLIEQELNQIKSSKLDLQKDILELKATIVKTQGEYNDLKSENNKNKQQSEQQNVELDIYKHQASRLKSDAKEKRDRYGELEDELKGLEVMLDDARYEGVEAVVQERKSILRREQGLMEQIKILELKVEELLGDKENLEQQNDEFRMDLETAILEKENSVFAEAALKRRINAMESRYGMRPTTYNRPARPRGPPVLVTMGSDQVKQLEKENKELKRKIKFLEAENRQLGKQANELQNQMELNVMFSKYSGRKHRKQISVEMLPNHESQYTNRIVTKSSQSLPNIN